MAKSKNLIDYLEKLSNSDKAYILAAMNGHKGGKYHIGHLPFFNKQMVVEKLQEAEANVKRDWILEKLGADVPSNSVVKFQITLDDKKVYASSKQLGKGTFIISLPTVMKAECGLQWSQFKKCYTVPKVDIPPTVKLVRTLHMNLWEASCHRKHLELARETLFYRYGAGVTRTR